MCDVSVIFHKLAKHFYIFIYIFLYILTFIFYIIYIIYFILTFFLYFTQNVPLKCLQLYFEYYFLNALNYSKIVHLSLKKANRVVDSESQR